MSELADVLLGDSGLPIAIFQSRHDALLCPDWDSGRVELDVPRSEAVGAIRRAVFRRDDFECRRCGELVTWKTGHLDEVISRGKGGEISVANCQVLCAKCHIVGPESKHGKTRLPQFSKGTK